MNNLIWSAGKSKKKDFDLIRKKSQLSLQISQTVSHERKSHDFPPPPTQNCVAGAPLKMCLVNFRLIRSSKTLCL